MPQKTHAIRRRPSRQKPKTGNGLPPREYAEIKPKPSPEIPEGYGDQVSTVSAWLYTGRITPYNPDDLVAKKGLEIYSRMLKDEQVKSALKTKQFAVLASGYKVVPPEVDEADKEMADETAEFVHFNFEEMEGSFDSKILEIMSADAYGFAVGEEIWGLIDYGKFDGKVSLKDLRFRRPFGIDFVTDEHGTLADDGVMQAQKRLPKEKFLIYSHNMEFSNFYGESDMRAVYRAYWSKDVILRFMNIALERYGEPVWDFTHTGRITPAQRTNLENFIKNLQSKTGIIHPDIIKAEMKTLGRGAAEAFIPAVKLYDSQISRGILMPELMGMSGEQQTGSLARSQTEFDVFMLMVERERRDVETAINEQATKRLIDLNYEVVGGMYPKFAFEVITEEHRQRIFGIWSGAVTTGALTKTREDENRARDLIDFQPLPDEVLLTNPKAQPSLQSPGLDGPLPFSREWYERRKEFQERALSKYERRVDFAALRAVYDKDAIRIDLELRALLKKAEAAMADGAEAIFRRGKLTPYDAQSFKIDTGQGVAKAMSDYLMSVWRKARDGAFRELPAKIKRQAEAVKRFQVNIGFEPVEALDFFNTRGLYVKGLIDDALTRQAKSILFEHLKGGRTTVETIGDLRELFEPYVGDPTKIAPSGPGVFAPENLLLAFRLENIVRTETTTALTQGRLAIGDAAGDYVIGYELSPVLDPRTSQICQQIGDTPGGFIVRKDDPRLAKLFPPLHFQCRTTPVFVTEIDVPVEWSDDSEINAVLELVPKGFK